MVEEQREEALGMKDEVETKVGKSEAGVKDVTAAEKRDKAINDAHSEYVTATEAARLAYVTAKEEATRVFEEATK